MKKRSFLSDPGWARAVGIVVAIVAGLIGLGYVSSKVKASGGGNPVDVLCAGRDIEPGTLLTAQMVSKKKIPERYRVPGSLGVESQVVGNRALRFLGRGEPFTRASVSGRSDDPVSSRLPNEERAYSLALTRGASTSELRAGDRVDVLATGGEPPRTRTLLRSRLVLSTGSVSGSDAPEERTSSRVTLQVTPPEAEALAQSECEGEISIAVCPMAVR